MCERWQTFSFDAYWPLMSIPLKLPGNFQYPPISKPVGPTPAHKNCKRLRNVASPRGTPGITRPSSLQTWNFTTELFTADCSGVLTTTNYHCPTSDQLTNPFLIVTALWGHPVISDFRTPPAFVSLSRELSKPWGESSWIQFLIR